MANGVPDDLYVLRREAGGSWSASPELIASSSTYSDYPLALAADSQFNLYVAWRGILMRRTATGGEWEQIGGSGYDDLGLDLVVNNDEPQIASTDPADSGWLNIWVNDANIVDGDVYHSQHPTLAVGPANMLVAVWQGEGGNQGPTRLYMSIYTRADAITKNYYAAGQRIATRVDGTLYYLLDDRLGSTTVVADDQGNEVGRVLYDPYGEVLESTLPAGITDRLFTGQRWDDTIGLYDYNARFYDPQLGQFTQPDSLVAEAGNPIAWNRYAYVYDNPVNLTDSSGHFVDTLLDVLDLANNVQNCLGDLDLLSCYMVPVSVAFVAVPFLSGGGMESRAARTASQADWMVYADEATLVIPDNEDALARFMKAREGKVCEDINCYGMVLKEYPEATGRTAIVDDLRPNPWDDNISGFADHAGRRIPNPYDKIETALGKHFDAISQADLRRGDVISWHRTVNRNLGWGHGWQDYYYTTHVGIYLGEGQVFSKMGWEGPYMKLLLESQDLMQYGTMRFWRPR